MQRTSAYLPLADPIPRTRLSLDAQIGIYLVNSQVTVYAHDTGKAAIPVAAADGAALEIVQRHAKSGGKAVFFALERYGLKPIIPGVEESDANIVFLGGRVVAAAPAVAVDGYTYIYRVEGVYFYAFKVPVWVDSAAGLPVGSTTNDRTPPSQNTLPAALFVDPGTAWAKTAPGDTTAILTETAGDNLASSVGAIKVGQNVVVG